MQVGDVVYFEDQNRRVYPDARAGGGRSPIFRGRFRKVKIVGETRVSWVLVRKCWVGGRVIDKLPKTKAWPPQFHRSLASVEDAIWADRHRHVIVRAIQSRGPDAVPNHLLRSIAAQIGVVEVAEEPWPAGESYKDETRE